MIVETNLGKTLCSLIHKPMMGLRKCVRAFTILRSIAVSHACAIRARLPTPLRALYSSIATPVCYAMCYTFIHALSCIYARVYINKTHIVLSLLFSSSLLLFSPIAFHQEYTKVFQAIILLQKHFPLAYDLQFTLFDISCQQTAKK